ncbi:hypothetical protein DFO62_105158 [Serratia fonticola]|nr:hypothetical protein DFO62_105158 [Serratia fonticola]
MIWLRIKTKFFLSCPLMLVWMAPSYWQPQLLTAGNTEMPGS